MKYNPTVTGMIPEEQPIRVLVAESNSISTGYLQLVLRQGGHTVQTAKTGSGAVRLFQSFRPDLVLIDTAFSESGGFAVLRRLARMAPDLKVEPQFIVLTTEERRYEREQAAAAGAADYLVKPVPPTALLKRIREVVSTAPVA